MSKPYQTFNIMMSRDSCLCFATVRADETWMFRSGGRAQPVDSVVVGAAHAILCINMQDVCQVWAVQYGQGGGDDWCSSPTARVTDWLSPLDDVPLYNKEPRWWWRRRRRRCAGRKPNLPLVPTRHTCFCANLCISRLALCQAVLQELLILLTLVFSCL